MNDRLDRRRFLARAALASGAVLLAGCDRLSRTGWFPKILDVAESLNRAIRNATNSRIAMAQEFSPDDLSPSFRSNGTADPGTPEYRRLAEGHFTDYRLEVGGQVQAPLSLSLDELRALPSRTQITRHDCVEGWSAIGKWKGVPLAKLLEAAQPTTQARFAVFHCADPMEDDGTSLYYESVDMDDAWHPQTILAYELNDKPLPVENGAPLRLRVERQLGYKQAKYIWRIEAVASLAGIWGGRGGFWEDNTDYEWYAGI